MVEEEKELRLGSNPTDPGWTDVLVREVHDWEPPVWDPACGDGAIVQAFQAQGIESFGTDISDDSDEDFLVMERKHPTIVTNPPYTLLDEFIRQGLRMATKRLALLMGWHHLTGSAKRTQTLWKPHPPHLVLCIPERMWVAGHGRSRFTHTWVVWERDQGRPDHTTLRWARAT